MADITLLPSAKVPLIYDGELTMTTEWYRFFWNIYGFTGTGVVPVNRGGTGLSTIGDHQIIIGNANNVFEPASLSSASLAITYPAGFVNLELSISTVTPGTYGSASQVGVFTVNQYGVLTAASNASIGIDASQIISGTIASARISGSYTGITGVGTLTAGTWNATTIGVVYGGTGQTSFTNGQLLIGNTTGNTLTKATLTAGTGVTITNGTGSITISATGSGGTVTSVTGTSPVVSSGGTTPAISLATAYGDTLNPYASKTANYFLAAPNGSAGVPTFRAIVAADIPSLSGTYIPYTGASSAIDLNAQTVTNIAHLGLNSTAVPDILLRAYGDNNSTSRIGIRGYSSNASSSSMRVAKFRGTFAAPQAPLSGDSLGKFELAGYGTTSSSGYPQASYEGVATENWSAIARGTKVLFYVTPNTTITQSVALTINQNSAATFASSVSATSFSGSGSGLTSIPNSALTNSTISGVSLGGNLFDLTAGTGVSFSAGTTYNGSAAITINATGSGGTVTSVAALTLGTTGTDLSSTVANGTTTPVITLQVPTASALNRGALSAADWTTFNGKVSSQWITTGSNIYYSTGSVGINTSSPTEKLSVNGGIVATAAASLTSGAGSYIYYTSGTSSAELTALSPGVAWLNQTYKALTHQWFISGTERMRITSAGDVGVGTSSPANKFQTTLTLGAGSPYIGINQVSDNPYIEYQRWTGAGTNYLGARIKSSDTGFVIFENSNSAAIGAQVFTERMRLSTAGNLGIGTASPGARVHASGSGAVIQIQTTDNAVFPGFKLLGSGGGQNALISTVSGTGGVTFFGTTVELMRIHNTGGVSINNTTDPGAGNLSVTGTIRTQGYTVATLPAAGTVGRRAYVTDALAPTFLTVIVGGGAVRCPVFDNGTAWVAG